jgi:hypothetical protein
MLFGRIPVMTAPRAVVLSAVLPQKCYQQRRCHHKAAASLNFRIRACPKEPAGPGNYVIECTAVEIQSAILKTDGEALNGFHLT